MAREKRQGRKEDKEAPAASRHRSRMGERRAVSEGSSLASRGSTSYGVLVGYRHGPPVPYHDDPSDYDPPVHCSCNLKCLKLISWSDGNPGRRYYRCSNVEALDCDCQYLEWIDPEYNKFLSTLLLDLRNAVKDLKRDVAAKKQAAERLQIMYEKQLRYKKKELLEKMKEVDAKDVVFQVLAARKSFGRQMGSIVFVFVVGVLCGACWKTMDN